MIRHFRVPSPALQRKEGKVPHPHFPKGIICLFVIRTQSHYLPYLFPKEGKVNDLTCGVPI